MAKKSINRRAAAPIPPEEENEAKRPSLAVKTDDKGRIFSHIRQKRLVETPEERVRQAYVVTLHNEYGFALEQMDEELDMTGREPTRPRRTWKR